MMGININCKHQDFIGEILRGEKTIETRNTPSLDPYIDRRVGLVRTGQGKAMLMGFATIREGFIYYDRQSFDADYELHKVAPDSPYYIKDAGTKVAYVLEDVEEIEPMPVINRGIIARDITCIRFHIDPLSK
jgi:hypothetical protein